MAAGIREVLANTVTTIEAVTPDTRWAGNKAYKHLSSLYDPEDALDHQSPTRRFVVELSGTRALDGPMGSLDSPQGVIQTLDVSIFYSQGTDAWELVRVVAEDVDRLGWELQKPTGYAQSTTGLWNRQAADYAITFDEAPGGTALVVIPVDVTYRPSFAG